MQFVPVQAQDIVGLRLKAGEGVLLHRLQARRKLFQPLGGFRSTGRCGFRALRVRLQ